MTPMTPMNLTSEALIPTHLLQATRLEVDGFANRSFLLGVELNSLKQESIDYRGRMLRVGRLTSFMVCQVRPCITNGDRT